MSEPFLDTTWKKPAQVDVAPRPIQQGEPGRIRPRAEVSIEEGAFVRRYVNDALNSRLTSTLPPGRWEVRWKHELDGRLYPDLVLRAGRRLLVQGPSRWQLFQQDGEQLAAGRLGPSDVVLDAAHALMYAMDRDGYLAAWRLDDGVLAFQLEIDYGDDFSRTYIARRGRRMVVVGRERDLQPHELPPDQALIEVLDLGDPPAIRADGILTSFDTLASLTRRTRLLMVALQNETLVIATQASVYVADLDLHLHSLLTGTFTPHALSLDEAQHVYLIVEDEEGRPALWVLSPGGELLVDAELPEVPAMPPIVGYDHRVYLVLGDHIRALSAEGDLLWEQHAGGTIAGAVVTADDRLLVAAGQLLAAFDAEGEREVVFYLEDDHWTTPPVLTNEGRILIASEHHLYCLQVNP